MPFAPLFTPRFRRAWPRMGLALLAFAAALLFVHPILHTGEWIAGAIGAEGAFHSDCPLHLNGTPPTPPDPSLPALASIPLPELSLPLPADPAMPRDPAVASAAIPRAPPSA